MTEVSFLAEALDEIEGARDWYAHKAAPVAARFVEEIARTIARIPERPLSFALVQTPNTAHEFRRARLRQFPYSLVFMKHGETIVILAACHDKRRPLYWSDRLPKVTNT